MVYQVAASATNEKPEVPEIEPEVQDLKLEVQDLPNQVAAASELEDHEQVVMEGEIKKEIPVDKTTEIEAGQFEKISESVTEKGEEAISLPEESEHLREGNEEKELVEEEKTVNREEILDNKEEKEKQVEKETEEKIEAERAGKEKVESEIEEARGEGKRH